MSPEAICVIHSFWGARRLAVARVEPKDRLMGTEVGAATDMVLALMRVAGVALVVLTQAQGWVPSKLEPIIILGMLGTVTLLDPS